MVGIGINSNVVIGSETNVNDKGTLELHLKNKSVSTKDALNMLRGEEDIQEGSCKLLVYPGYLVDYNTKERLSDATIIKNLQAYKNTLSKFLTIYMTKEQITEQFGPNAILGAAKDDVTFIAGLKSDDFVASIYTYIANTFLKVLTANKIQENEKSFRIKLHRQSAAKPYPCLVKSLYDSELWIEPMDVPTPMVVETKYDRTPFKNTDITKLDSSPVAKDVIPVEEVATANVNFSTPDEFPSDDMDKPLFTD